MKDVGSCLKIRKVIPYKCDRGRREPKELQVPTAVPGSNVCFCVNPSKARARQPNLAIMTTTNASRRIIYLWPGLEMLKESSMYRASHVMCPA